MSLLPSLSILFLDLKMLRVDLFQLMQLGVLVDSYDNYDKDKEREMSWIVIRIIISI